MGGGGVGVGKVCVRDVWVGVVLTSSQFEREGMTLKALGNFPDLYLLRILPTLGGERQQGRRETAGEERRGEGRE